ncbi:tail fiber protein [Erythrobacter phage vB_EliS-L02]|nr:tail fiber protein [Erythrobacter phage vB_EliS-L02]
MATTPLLGITQVTPSQNNKEVTINDAIEALEAATNARLEVDFSPQTTITLSNAQVVAAFIYEATGATAASTLQIPTTINSNPVSRIIAVRNTSGHELTVQFVGAPGSTVAIPNGEARLLAAMNGTDVIVAAEPQSTVSFVSLNDTPASLTGQAGRFLTANLAENALEFADAAVFPAYTDNAGKYLVVNQAENGVEWVTLEVATSFTQLTDSPASYTGQAGRYVVVTAGEDGVEFIDLPDLEAVEFVAAQRWRLRVVTAGVDPQVGFGEVQWLDVDGINLVSGGTASASNEATGNEAEFAFDGNTDPGNGWLTEASFVGTIWLEYDFGTPVTPRTVRAFPVNNFPDYSPTRFVIEYWNGASWIAAGDRTTAPWDLTASQDFKVNGQPLTSIPEAPNDGQTYARQSGSWVVFEPGVGLSEAVVVSGTAVDLTAAQSTQYLRFTATSAKTLTVRPEATEALPDNGEWHLQNEGDGDLTVTPGAGVTINEPVDGTLIIPTGGTATLKRVAADTFNLIGVTNQDPALPSPVAEAPVDGTFYVRQDGSWVSLPPNTVPKVRAASTANVTLASDVENGDTLDGVTLATGDRILLKDQTAPAENGIYVVAASGAPARATDANSSDELVNYAAFVSEGSTNADKFFQCTTNAPIVVGTTGLTFTEVAGAGGGNVAVEDDGSEIVAAASRLNFTGAGVTVTDSGSGEVEIAIPGGGSGGLGAEASVQLIEEYTGDNSLSSWTSSQSFAGYDEVFIEVMGRDGTTAANFSQINLRLNGDTGNNYDAQNVGAQNTSATGGQALATNGIKALAFLPGTTVATNFAARARFKIVDPSNTTFHKIVETTANFPNDASNGNSFIRLGYGRWRNAAAVTSATVYFDNGTGRFGVGTKIRVLGVKYGTGDPVASSTVTEATAAANLLNTNRGKYQRWTATGAKTLTVQPNATEAITQDAEFFIRNAAASGDLTIVAGTGVTINAPFGGSLVMSPGMSATLKRVAENEFDLVGQTVAA